MRFFIMSSISKAIIPYTPPKAPMEFIRSEVERSRKNGIIKPDLFAPTKIYPLSMRCSYFLEFDEKICFLTIARKLVYPSIPDRSLKIRCCTINTDYSCKSAAGIVPTSRKLDLLRKELISSKISYGTLGEQTIDNMTAALKIHSMALTYNEETKKFTVDGSSGLGKEAIEKIFAKNIYRAWVPIVLDETDPFGNQLVKLECRFTDKTSSRSRICGGASAKSIESVRAFLEKNRLKIK